MCEWARDVKAGIEIYKERVLPYLEKKEFWFSAMELGNAIYPLNEARKLLVEIPQNFTIDVQLIGLIAMLKTLEQYCLHNHEKGEERSLTNMIERIEDKLPFIELAINGSLKAKQE